MSEKSKGDTSSFVRVVKNPLLSASVTGLTFDDFPNKPLLLPAAPPVMPAAPIVAPPAGATSGVIGRGEPKSLVTVGSGINDLDTENLDEINLNATTEESQPALIDTNANSLLEQQQIGTESILSQAASSFSALPSVASSVFSTFSKRIYTGSTSRERTPIADNGAFELPAHAVPQLDIQPSYTQQQQQQQQPPLPSIFSTTAVTAAVGGPFEGAITAPVIGQAPALSNAPPAEPPKFYTPSELPTLPPTGAAPPPTSANQNTYRLSAKKKIYAPIPGLSNQAQAAIAPVAPAAVVSPLVFDSAQLQQVPQYDGYSSYTQSTDAFSPPQYTTQETPRPEERKAGIFTGVLQNISGLVQSAAGTLTQGVRSEPQQLSTSHYQQPQASVSFDPSYFGAPGIQQPTTAAPLPTSYPATVQPYQGIDSSNAFAPPPLFNTPQQQQQEQQHVVPLETSQFGTVPQQTEPVTHLLSTTLPPAANQPPPQFGFVAQVPKKATPEVVPNQQPLSILDPTQASAVQSTDNIISNSAAFFQPVPIGSALPPASAFVAQAPVTAFGAPAAANFAAPLAHTSVSQPFAAPPTPAATTVTNIFQPIPTPPTSDAFAPLSVVAPNLSPAVAGVLPSVVAAVPPSVAAPPTFAASQPPPASGSTSFRLQKGTRLYKNPLTTAETAPSYANQPFGVPPPSNQLTSAVFTPFGPPATTNGASSAILTPSLFTPNTQNVSAEPQSVPLFTSQETQPIADLKSTAAAPTLPPELTQNQPTEIKENAALPPVSVALIPATQPLFSPIETESIELFSPLPATKPIATAEATNAIAPPEIDSNLNQSPEKAASALITPECLQAQTIEPVSTQASEPTSPEPEKAPGGFDPLEEVVEKFSLAAAIHESEVSANLAPPPSLHGAAASGNANPYRKGLQATSAEPTGTASASIAPPTLAHFFTPTPSDGGGDFNFFAAPAATPTHAPIPSAEKATAGSFFDATTTTGAVQAATNAVNFFTNFPEEQTASDFKPSAPTEPTTTQAAFPPLPAFATITSPASASIVEPTSAPLQIAPPPIGFDNLVAETLAAGADATETSTPTDNKDSAGDIQKRHIVPPSADVIENNSALNSFSNYFEQTSKFPVQTIEVTPQNLSDSSSSCFFNTIASLNPNPNTNPNSTPAARALTQSNEDQRIQNFFNNPPPKENGSGVGDLNYDLVHSGLAVKNLQTRSLTPASNLAEPPSSSCSEWSELNTSAAAQRLSGIDHTPKVSPEKIKSVEVPSRTALPEQETATAVEINHYEELPEEILQELRMANLLVGGKEAGGTAGSPPAGPHPSVSYKPAVKHWFFKRHSGTKYIWTPFSHYDSALLETTSAMGDEAPHLVAVEGGRYDVNIRERTKAPVYWEGQPIEVRRCSWFYKAVDNKYVPYEEQTAELLEVEYKQAAESGAWHKKIILSMGEQVVFHGPTVIVHFQQQQNADAWGGTSQTTTRPRVVKRDLYDFIIDQGESQRVDHLLFMVHGIGAACDLKMRSVEEVVDEFRGIAQQLVQSHYRNSTDMGVVGRVEVLPVSWHGHLHSVEMGIDEKLKSITLESIPRLRSFTNDTLLDVLFYTSPTYCQKIMNTVATSMNTVYVKYCQRHPDFNGGVSLAGHSLGSLILFDLLCHQTPVKEREERNMENPDQEFASTQPTDEDDDETAAKHASYMMGHAGTGQPFISYTQLIFQPKKFFALGSPIGMFVTIRGIDQLGLDFHLPTCPGFYNIFHPFDPVAYRIEALVNPDMSGIRPVLIPHHKGRKRMHLELKETMTRVGADLKQRFFDTFKMTLDSVNFLNTTSKSKKESEAIMEKEVDQVIAMQMQLEREQRLQQQQQQEEQLEEQHLPQQITLSPTQTRLRADSGSSEPDMVEVDFPLGKLNESKRVDYVLQEAPLEFFNEYLFALSSHVCYWESEDTILFVMKEIYSGLGISTDSQVPQQTMTIERERPNSRNSNTPSLFSTSS